MHMLATGPEIGLPVKRKAFDDNPTPAKRHKGIRTQWTWKEEGGPIHYPEGDQMFFVNRERAMQQLLEIYKSNHNRAQKRLGMDLVILIMDSFCGLGKTAFACEFIRRRKAYWDGLSIKNTLLDTLRQCHTIIIEFGSVDLLDIEDNFKLATAANELVRHIYKDQFGIRPLALAPDAISVNQNVRPLMRRLTNEVGPLFVVIDDIGIPFSHTKLDDKEKRDRFMMFSETVLFPQLLVRNLFFLVVGHNSFLRHYPRARHRAGAHHTGRSMCDVLDNLPVLPVQPAVSLSPATPLLEALDHPAEYAALGAAAAAATTGAAPVDKAPIIYSHVNRVLDRIAANTGVEAALSSHSFRRGGAQRVNGCDGFTHRWIFDRGVWNMSTSNKGLHYIFNTSRENHKVIKALSGYDAEVKLLLKDSKFFDAQTQEKIAAVPVHNMLLARQAKYY
ncbi:hypothetical protein PC110_g17881 [Phytophthora cactorum]|uniref:P-loop containing nucleoside triphosphate hydrolase n=1 Tax=Phytophthora cactorum TaxID=29920 RepID=A0A329RM06_9STRA|nr:hypothetical protein PC110_g17881 [Phytophthora cactorum]